MLDNAWMISQDGYEDNCMKHCQKLWTKLLLLNSTNWVLDLSLSKKKRQLWGLFSWTGSSDLIDCLWTPLLASTEKSRSHCFLHQSGKRLLGCPAQTIQAVGQIATGQDILSLWYFLRYFLNVAFGNLATSGGWYFKNLSQIMWQCRNDSQYLLANVLARYQMLAELAGVC